MSHLFILKKKKTVLSILLLGSLLGFVLQILQTVTRSTFPAVLLTVLSVLVVAFAILTARQFRPRPGFLQNHIPTPALLVQLASIVPLMLASVIHLFLKNEPAPILIGLTGILGTACMALITLCAILRRHPSILLYVGLTLSLTCRLIPEFRVWSISPDLGSYAPSLLALLTMMLSCLHLGFFTLNTGNRHLTIVLCIVGVFFNLVSLASGGIYQILWALGCTLFLSATLWELLTLPRRRRKTIPES